MARVPLNPSGRRTGRGRKENGNGWSVHWSRQLKPGKFNKGDTINVILTAGKYPNLNGDPQFYMERVTYKVTEPTGYGFSTSKYYVGAPDEDRCTLRSRADVPDENRVNGPRYMNEPNRWWFGIIHLGLFAAVESTDKQGNVKLFKNGRKKGEPIMEHRLVSSSAGRNKAEAAGFENYTFFQKKYFEASFSIKDKLMSIVDEAKTMCDCGGVLRPEIYFCTSCEELLEDAADTELTDGELLDYGRKPVRCGECGHVENPGVQYSCSDCNEPSPHKPWHVVAELKIMEDNGFPSFKVHRVTPITEFTFPDGSAAAAIDPNGDIVFHEGLEKVMQAQWDFEGHTAPKGNAWHSGNLNLREGDPGFESSSTNYSNFR
jgi:hypothetical protein